jgi:hypothetical protein
VIFSASGGVYMDVDMTRRDDTIERTSDVTVRAIGGWSVAVRLAVAMSVAAALVVATFHGRVADSTLILGVIVVAGVAGWISAERAPVPAPIRLRRR